MTIEELLANREKLEKMIEEDRKKHEKFFKEEGIQAEDKARTERINEVFSYIYTILERIDRIEIDKARLQVSIENIEKEIKSLSNKFDIFFEEYLRIKSPKTQKLSPTQEKVLQLIKQNPNAKLKDLAAQTGLSITYLSHIIQALRRKRAL
jgi:methylphosphotriester-DNA--protein-cysteine methyltransferase